MWYTYYVKAKKQNLTLTIEEDLLLEARQVALQRHTSVNQLVREFLGGLVEEQGRRRRAQVRLGEIFQRGLVEVGPRTWSRDDLYDR